MKAFPLALALVGLLAASMAPLPAVAKSCSTLSAETLAEIQLRSVVIHAYTEVMPGFYNIPAFPGRQNGLTPRYGSGILLNARLVLTAAHVIHHVGEVLEIEVFNRSILGKAIAYDKRGGQDLSLIQLAEPVVEASVPLAVAKSSLRKGTAVWLWSSRQGRVLRRAVVGPNLQPIINEKPLTGASYAGIPGDSGSGFLNCRGQLAGIMATWRVSQKLEEGPVDDRFFLWPYVNQLAGHSPQDPRAWWYFRSLGMRSGLVKVEGIRRFLQYNKVSTGPAG